MVFKTTGNKSEPVVLFFHAMGVTGESSMPVADKLAGKFYCIMPTSTVYCSGQRYCSKRDEVQQVVRFLEKQEIKEIELVVASSIGADLAIAFVTNAKIPVKHIFFDGGQFAQIGKVTRRIMVPFLYVAMKSLYWSNGKTLKKIMWCDDDKIKPYFIKAGKNLTYRNLRRQLTDSLEDKPFPKLPEELQKHTFWEFGSKEEHFKYRSAVMQTYIYGNFPVFQGFNHMQYQIRDPEGFARMLETIMETDRLPKLTFAIWYKGKSMKNAYELAETILKSRLDKNGELKSSDSFSSIELYGTSACKKAGLKVEKFEIRKGMRMHCVVRKPMGKAIGNER